MASDWCSNCGTQGNCDDGCEIVNPDNTPETDEELYRLIDSKKGLASFFERV